MSSETIGVGFIGAGPVTQAIHVPTLARIGAPFRVVAVMDVDAAVAESVADRVHASWTTDATEILANDAVDVVAVCSPHRFHAEQVIAACRAGKRAVFCEKPFAMSREEAKAIMRVSAETGVPIIVGAMHTFDPAWVAARSHAEALLATAHTIRYSIVLPPNPRFEDFATQVVGRPVAMTPPDRSDPEVAAADMFGQVMGLAIHDLPLVRAFCPDFRKPQLLDCRIPQLGGYVLDLQVGNRAVRVEAIHTDGWQPEWCFEVIGDDSALRIDFTPSYVHAGSGTAVVTLDGERTVFGPFAQNGYEAEWRYLAALVEGRAEPLHTADLIEDVTFALTIAKQASQAARALVAGQQSGAAA
ncbi:Gfo/Idh/MocA family protein [Curtobacterium ammoniigenes]|uniref:Gfo/Idh/MocA family protein n=1 Tax=Curtobacterium ammoniigenes TaxID=395387 RepID=UPI00082CA71E|nr:Gfo/Idh/MocA family oxidoreductase [Curtobacterium ammoniigenes]